MRARLILAAVAALALVPVGVVATHACGFEESLCNFALSGTATGAWTRQTASGSAFTGPSSACEGSFYASAVPGLANSDAAATFVMTEPLEGSFSGWGYSFWYYMHGSDLSEASKEGSIAFKTSTDGATFTQRWIKVGQVQTSQADLWGQAVIDLSMLSPRPTHFQFVGVSSGYKAKGNIMNAMALDDLRVIPMPTTAPTPLPTARPTLHPFSRPTPQPKPEPTRHPVPRPTGFKSPWPTTMVTTLNCPAGSYSNAGACVDCTAGKFDTGTGRTADCITDCSAGKYSNAGSACIDCISGKYSALAASACTSCPMGKFAVGTGSVDTCPDCAAGSYCATTGLSAVTDLCAVGKFSAAGATACTDCAAGTFAVATGSAVTCPDCTAGSYCATTGLTAVTEACAVGTFSAAGAAYCTSCAAGTFSVGTGSANACLDCTAGSYCATMGLSAVTSSCAIGTFSAAGAAACTNCAIGKFASGTGSVDTCAACTAGQFQDSEGEASCNDCTAGKFDSGSGRIADCTNVCLAGSFSNAGASACTSCFAGTYASGTGSQYFCPDCDAGSYCATSGLSAVTGSCAVGKFSSAGATACTDCEVGSYSAAGVTVCTDCAAGYYAASTGASSCVTCTEGQYQSATGQGLCIGCPAGKTSDLASVSVENCFGPTPSPTYSQSPTTVPTTLDTVAMIVTMTLAVVDEADGAKVTMDTILQVIEPFLVGMIDGEPDPTTSKTIRNFHSAYTPSRRRLDMANVFNAVTTSSDGGQRRLTGSVDVSFDVVVSLADFGFATANAFETSLSAALEEAKLDSSLTDSLQTKCICGAVITIFSLVPADQYPTLYPTIAPSLTPTRLPTIVPTPMPTPKPTLEPTHLPTYLPTPWPTKEPTAGPIVRPTFEPTPFPSSSPTSQPTRDPTPTPTFVPTLEPSSGPTPQPFFIPIPSQQPSFRPTQLPTPAPSVCSDMLPICALLAPAPLLKDSWFCDEDLLPYVCAETCGKCGKPSSVPVPAPSAKPSLPPSPTPTVNPLPVPTVVPVPSPSAQPTGAPLPAPTPLPSAAGTVTIKFEMTVSASSGEVTQAVIASALDAKLDSRYHVRNIVVAFAARRAARRRLLGTATVTFEVFGSLGDFEVASAGAFEKLISAAIDTTLDDGSLTAAIQAACGSGCTAVVTTAMSTGTLRSYPTLLPFPSPSSIPLPAPSAVPRPTPTSIPIPAPTPQPTVEVCTDLVNFGRFRLTVETTDVSLWGTVKIIVYQLQGDTVTYLPYGSAIDTAAFGTHKVGTSFMCLPKASSGLKTYFRLLLGGANNVGCSPTTGDPACALSAGEQTKVWWKVTEVNNDAAEETLKGYRTKDAYFSGTGVNKQSIMGVDELGNFINSPTFSPTVTQRPTFLPIPLPTKVPVPLPTKLPLPAPTKVPIPTPSEAPIPAPSEVPLPSPTKVPVLHPTAVPIPAPSPLPTSQPTPPPSPSPTPLPSLHCDRGFFLNDQNGRCTRCPWGHFSNVTRVPWASACELCPGGHFADATAVNNQGGIPVCFECADGLNSFVDRTGCGICDPGQYSLNSSCEWCTFGKYAPKPMDEDCLACQAGYYSGYEAARSDATTGATKCLECLPGKTSVGITDVCVSCPKGTFAGSGFKACKACEPGRYSPKAGESSCSLCSVGTYTIDRGVSECEACPRGTYQQASGQTACDACVSGTFQSKLGQPFCLSCATGYWSVSESESCTICAPNYYLMSKKTPESPFVCRTCPDSARCEGGIFLPIPDKGFWSDLSSGVRDDMAIMYKCPSFMTCQAISDDLFMLVENKTADDDDDGSGDDGGRRRLEVAKSCFEYDESMGNISKACLEPTKGCSVGSFGIMCGSCEEGYFLDTASRACSVCSMEGVIDSLLIAAALGCATVVLFLIFRSGGVPVPRALVERHGWPDRLQVPLVGGLMSIDKGAIKVIVSTLQIIASISGSLDVSYPEPFGKFANMFSFVQISFISIDCVADRNYHDEVYSTSTFPLVLCGAVAASYLFRVFFNPFLTKAQRGEEFAKHAGWVLLVTYLVLPKVATVQFQGLNCVHLVTGEAYVRADTSIDCNGAEHQAFIVVDALLILIYQAIPVGYLAVLVRNKHRLVPAGAVNTEVAMKTRDKDSDLDPIRFLFQDLSLDSWYHEVVDMYRRIFFISVLPLVGSDLVVRSYAGCVLSLGSAVYFREVSPYRTPSTNVLGFIAQYQILTVFVAVLLIHGQKLVVLGMTDFGIGCALVVINSLIFVVAIYAGQRQFALDEIERLKMIKKVRIEWAANFTSTKFQTTLDSVAETSVPASHVLVYHYTSLAAAREMSTKGVPALAATGGVVVTTLGPQAVAKGNSLLVRMGPVSATREAVVCIRIPRTLLYPLEPISSSSGDPTSPGVGRHHLRRQRTTINALTAGPHPDGLMILPLAVLSALAPTETEEARIKRHGDHAARQKKRLAAHKAAAKAEAAQKPRGQQFNRSVDVEMGTEGAPRPPLRASSYLHARPPHDPPIMLPLNCVLRIYQLVDDRNCTGRAHHDEDLDHEHHAANNLTQQRRSTSAASTVAAPGSPGMAAKAASVARAAKSAKGLRDPGWEPIAVTVPATVEELCLTLAAARARCEAQGFVAMFHYTIAPVAPLIARTGFRMSTQGQGDGGVYFSTLSPMSYGIGSKAYEANIIEDCFGPERIHEYLGKHKLDICLVYGATPKVLYPAPGGRNNARMVQRSIFEALGTPELNGDHFLRGDRLVAAFDLNPARGLAASGDTEAALLAAQVEADKKTVRTLDKANRLMQANASRSRGQQPSSSNALVDDEDDEDKGGSSCDDDNDNGVSFADQISFTDHEAPGVLAVDEVGSNYTPSLSSTGTLNLYTPLARPPPRAARGVAPTRDKIRFAAADEETLTTTLVVHAKVLARQEAEARALAVVAAGTDDLDDYAGKAAIHALDLKQRLAPERQKSEGVQAAYAHHVEAVVAFEVSQMASLASAAVARERAAVDQVELARERSASSAELEWAEADLLRAIEGEATSLKGELDAAAKAKDDAAAAAKKRVDGAAAATQAQVATARAALEKFAELGVDLDPAMVNALKGEPLGPKAQAFQDSKAATSAAAKKAAACAEGEAREEDARLKKAAARHRKLKQRVLAHMYGHLSGDLQVGAFFARWADVAATMTAAAASKKAALKASVAAAKISRARAKLDSAAEAGSWPLDRDLVEALCGEQLGPRAAQLVADQAAQGVAEARAAAEAKKAARVAKKEEAETAKRAAARAQTESRAEGGEPLWTRT